MFFDNECVMIAKSVMILFLRVRINDMKTSEIITSICSHLGISKADLAKRMGLHPSSLYRKLSKESMTFEELQKCLGVLGVG